MPSSACKKKTPACRSGAPRGPGRQGHDACCAVHEAVLISGDLPETPQCTAPPRFFFFNDTATTEIYTLSLHDALPICTETAAAGSKEWCGEEGAWAEVWARSEEHTSELQSQFHLVCRLLLEKKQS